MGRAKSRYYQCGLSYLREPLRVRPAPEGYGRGDGLCRSEAIRIACDCAGVGVADAMSLTRMSDIAYRRFHVFRLLHRRGWSLSEIGRYFGPRDHTTVLHGLRRAEVVCQEVMMCEAAE